MKITASRRDDILREQARYNAEAKKQNDTHKYQEKRLRYAQDFNHAQVENAIRSQVPGLEDVDIRVESRWFDEGIQVSFNSENRGENKALRWSWSVSLSKDGKITKESSSWSGLEAITPEQVADLQKTTNIIGNLVNLDWTPILKAGLEGTPDYYDYISVREMKNKDSEFERQLKLADIEDVIGQEKWIKGSVIPNENNRYERGDRWYMIHKQSDKFYTISYVNDWTVQSIKKNQDAGSEGGGESLRDRLERETQYTERTKKDNFIRCIYTPVEVMDMDGNVTTAGGESETAEASTGINGLVTL